MSCILSSFSLASFILCSALHVGLTTFTFTKNLVGTICKRVCVKIYPFPNALAKDQ